jgi:serine/threonine-protein phosphatase PGAM5
MTALGLRNYPFKACFSSPITRARECAEIIWEGRGPDIIYTDDLSEAYLGWLQGMKNDFAAEHYPEVYGVP